MGRAPASGMIFRAADVLTASEPSWTALFTRPSPRRLAPLVGVSKFAVGRLIAHLGTALALRPRRRFRTDTVLIVDGRHRGIGPVIPHAGGDSRDSPRCCGREGRPSWGDLSGCQSLPIACRSQLRFFPGGTSVDILLIAGLWLDGSAWDDVVPELTALGHRPMPLTLPGQGDGTTSATLDDQLAAVLAAVDAAPGKPLVVGHSVAASLAWSAADARPEKVAKVVLVGGFPAADGRAYADYFAIEGGVMPFPGWGSFEGADSADLDQETRDRIASAAVPVPESVARGVVRLADARRFDVPVVLVCPEVTPDQAKEWIAAGESPDLARATHLEYVDLDSGHWPMTTRPRDLARVLAEAASS